jgi:stage II sporulation protein D
MMYDGEIINAVYFSSSGGVTEDSINVWVTAVPYLRSVVEIAEHEPMIWDRVYTLSNIDAMLAHNNINIGRARSVSVTHAAVSGRVTAMTINGTNGSHTVHRDAVRTFFTSGEQGSLPSLNFTMQTGTADLEPTQVYVTDGTTVRQGGIAEFHVASATGVTVVNRGFSAVGATGVRSYPLTTMVVTSGGNDIIFSGSGWGHGVGMSQRGAEGMARLGYDHRDILRHYYTGVAFFHVW